MGGRERETRDRNKYMTASTQGNLGRKKKRKEKGWEKDKINEDGERDKGHKYSD